MKGPQRTVERWFCVELKISVVQDHAHIVFQKRELAVINIVSPLCEEERSDVVQVPAGVVLWRAW